MMREAWAVARQELRLAWRDRTVALLGIVMTLMTAAATMVAQARHDAEDAQRLRYQEVVGRQFADQPDRHPHRVSHYGYLLFRPRAPLGYFDQGVETFAGTSIFLEAHRQNSANFSAASQSGGAERFGEFTPASALQLFLPLFLFGVAGVSVTREREAGTLPLLLCQGLSWPEVLWGKVWGCLLIAASVVTPPALLLIGWLAARGELATDADTLARGTGLVVAHAGFFVACTALGVAVSASHQTSRGALVSLVAIWFALWIVVPRLVPMAATALYPIPARSAFDAEVEARVRELGDSHNPDDPVFARFRADTLKQYGVDRVEDLPLNYGGLVMREAERHTAEAFDEHRARLLAVYRRQAGLVDLAGSISPYLAIRGISMALAGSNAEHLFEFERQAEAFRYTLIQALNELHIHEVESARDRYGDVTNGAPSRQRIDAAFFRQLPALDYQRPPLAWALRSHRAGLVSAAVGVLLILAGLVRCSRQRPLPG
jgi:ABC-2 type transport system permease protein